MTSAIEYAIATAETITPRQIRWVYKNATARRAVAAFNLLVEIEEGAPPGDRTEYEAARQICAEAWNDGRALARRRLRVDVELLLPRPSPRIIASAEEGSSAMDWHVSATVRDWSVRDDEGAIVQQGEGSVSLYQPRREQEPEAWAPCRHCNDYESDELSWVHGNLRHVLAWLQQLSPAGIEGARQLVIAVSGEGMRMRWTDPSEAHPRLLDVDPEGIAPGDIVEHRGSRRVGVVMGPTARVHRDRTVEHPIHAFGDESTAEWSSVHIRRLPWEDPYRRYLELRWAADGEGVVIPSQDWARLAIELSGVGMPSDATGDARRIQPVNPRDARAIRRARSHWWDAANDCSRRAGVSPGSSPSSGS